MKDSASSRRAEKALTALSFRSVARNLGGWVVRRLKLTVSCRRPYDSGHRAAHSPRFLATLRNDTLRAKSPPTNDHRSMLEIPRRLQAETLNSHMAWGWRFPCAAPAFVTPGTRTADTDRGRRRSEGAIGGGIGGRRAIGWPPSTASTPLFLDDQRGRTHRRRRRRPRSPSPPGRTRPARRRDTHRNRVSLRSTSRPARAECREPSRIPHSGTDGSNRSGVSTCRS